MFAFASGIIGAAFAIFVIFILIMRGRRRMWHNPDQSFKPSAFDLAELHVLRAKGQISPAEFDRLVAILAGRENQSPPVHGPRGFDVIPDDNHSR